MFSVLHGRQPFQDLKFFCSLQAGMNVGYLSSCTQYWLIERCQDSLQRLILITLGNGYGRREGFEIISVGIDRRPSLGYGAVDTPEELAVDETCAAFDVVTSCSDFGKTGIDRLGCLEDACAESAKCAFGVISSCGGQVRQKARVVP